MRSGALLLIVGFGMGLGLSSLVGCHNETRVASTAITSADSSESEPISELTWADAGPIEQESPAKDIETAPATPLVLSNSPAFHVPPGPQGELIQLALGGADNSRLIEFVNSCTQIFGLKPEDIIYMTDIGMSADVIKAAIEHDHLLAGQLSNLAQDLAATAPEAAPYPSIADNPALPPDVPVEQENEPDYSYSPPASPIVIGGEVSPEPMADVPEEDFVNILAPYGTWNEVEGVGACWQPTVSVIDSGWRPYVDRGRWQHTTAGWCWESGYSWGWAPFHYGRWFQHEKLGWCWRPGHKWAPAWVAWRESKSQVGWAPLPPGFSHKNEGKGFHGVGHPSLAAPSYSFVSATQLESRNLRAHAERRDKNAALIAATVPAPGVNLDAASRKIINTGINPAVIAAAKHHPVKTEAVEQAARDIMPRRATASHPTSGVTLASHRQQNVAPRTLAVAKVVGTAPAQNLSSLAPPPRFNVASLQQPVVNPITIERSSSGSLVIRGHRNTLGNLQRGSPALQPGSPAIKGGAPAITPINPTPWTLPTSIQNPAAPVPEQSWANNQSGWRSANVREAHFANPWSSSQNSSPGASHHQRSRNVELESQVYRRNSFPAESPVSAPEPNRSSGYHTAAAAPSAPPPSASAPTASESHHHASSASSAASSSSSSSSTSSGHHSR